MSAFCVLQNMRFILLDFILLAFIFSVLFIFCRRLLHWWVASSAVDVTRSIFWRHVTWLTAGARDPHASVGVAHESARSVGAETEVGDRSDDWD